MLSIFDVFNWVANTNYLLHDIYRYNNLYYYAIRDFNSGNTFNSDYSNGITTYNGQLKPIFFFLPSYSSNVDIKPLVKETRFSDGYSQRSPDGISSVLLQFNVILDKRTDAEARAILHFLTQRKSVESFVWVPPFPFNATKLFVCSNFKHTTVFKANHSIDCSFQEVVI